MHLCLCNYLDNVEPQVTRSEMGRYMCIARNGVPPAVSKTIQLNVNCE